MLIQHINQSSIPTMILSTVAFVSVCYACLVIKSDQFKDKSTLIFNVNYHF